MNKTMKILTILLVILMIITACGTVLADDDKEDGKGTLIGGVNIAPKKDAGKQVEGIGNSILGMIQVVGTIIAVGVLMVIGIKYMMGSAEEKAEYKKTMLPYLIGAIILFAAVNIAAAVINMSNTLTANDSKDDGKTGAIIIEDGTKIA